MAFVPGIVSSSARVVSFDARTGRYAVSLEDGKDLSLKAESEEACQAVRYCSRECQRTDWKAHKPVWAAQP